MRRSHRPAPVLAILVLTLPTLALTTLLAACGGGTSAPKTSAPDTSAPSLTITSQTSATSATYHLKGKTTDNVGATRITYSVDGGPSKTVDLSGGTFDVTVTLHAGQNTIDVKAYDAAGNVKDVVFHVTYTPPSSTTGSLKVTIQNLPSGTPANVDVTGPSSFSKNVTGTTTLNNLAPGTYTITPHDAFVKLVDLKGKATPGSVDVAAGATASTTVAYTATYGFLDLTVSGLPSGVNAAITVTGSTGAPHTITVTTTLTGLPDDTYTVRAASVTTRGATYDPTPSNQQVALAGGQSGTANVSYATPAPTSGSLTIAVSGLQNGTPANVTVTGPSGSATPASYTLTTGATLNGLPAGTYTVTPHDVSGTLYDYSGSAAQTSVAVPSGGTASDSVGYHATTGALTVSVANLPSSTAAGVTVSGSGGPYTVDATRTIAHLQTGPYSFVTKQLKGSDGELYDDTADNNMTVTVGAGATASATLAFVQVSGDLSVSIFGVTSGNIDVSLLGSVVDNVTRSITLKGLYAASGGSAYGIATHDVKASGYDWTGHAFLGGAIVTSVAIQRAQTTTISVNYIAQDGAFILHVSSSSASVHGSVDFSDPSGASVFSNAGVGTTEKDYLRVGTYKLTVHAVHDSNYDFVANGFQVTTADLVMSIPISNGATQTANIDYVPLDGRLVLDFSGPIEPDSSGTTKTYSATVKASDGSTYATPSKTVSTSTSGASITLPYTPADSYTVVPATYSDYGSICINHPSANFYKWTASVTPSPAGVAAGATKSVAVAYQHALVACATGP